MSFAPFLSSRVFSTFSTGFASFVSKISKMFLPFSVAFLTREDLLGDKTGSSVVLAGTNFSVSDVFLPAFLDDVTSRFGELSVLLMVSVAFWSVSTVLLGVSGSGFFLAVAAAFLGDAARFFGVSIVSMATSLGSSGWGAIATVSTTSTVAT